MKKKTIISFSLVLIIIGFLFVLYFLFYSQSSFVTKIKNKSWDSYHVNISYKIKSDFEEKINMDMNVKFKSAQYTNTLGTFVYILEENNLLFFYLNPENNLWYSYPSKGYDKKTSDITSLYYLFAGFLRDDAILNGNIVNVELSKENTNSLKNLLQIISSKQVDSNLDETWKCEYKIDNDIIENALCFSNIGYVLSAEFTNFNSIDKSKLLKIESDKIQYTDIEQFK